MYSDFFAYKTITRNVTGWSSTSQSTEMLLKDDLDVTEWHSYDQSVTFADLCYLAVDWTAELHPLCVIWPRFLFYFQHIKMSWYPCPKYLWFTNQNKTSFVSCFWYLWLYIHNNAWTQQKWGGEVWNILAKFMTLFL